MKKLLAILVISIAIVFSSGIAKAAIIYGPDSFSSLSGWTTSGPVSSGQLLLGPSSPVGNPYAIMSAGSILFFTYNSSMTRTISTLNYNNIALDYYRRTSGLNNPGEGLLVQWKPTSGSIWNTLENTTGTSWSHSAFSLLGADNSSIDIRFTLTSTERSLFDLDRGLIDGLRLQGDVIPEPMSLSLLGLGLLGLIGLKKKKK